MINLVIGVTGKISSGKSTFSKRLSGKYGWPIVSFGKYLVDYSLLNELPINRPSLQFLGDKMIKENHQVFLNNVLLFSNAGTDRIIVEGIRHKVIWEELKKRSKNYELVFIDALQQLRYERFCQRLKPGDTKVSLDEFITIDGHIVEEETDQLKMEATSVVLSESSEELGLIDFFAKYDL